MGIVQCIGHRRDDLDDFPGRHTGGITLAQQPPGVGTVDVVHRDPQLPVELTAVVDTDDMRVVQRGGKFGLTVEPGPEFGIHRHLGGQDLQRVLSR